MELGQTARPEHLAYKKIWLMIRKLKFFGSVKGHKSLEIEVMEDMALGGRGTGRPSDEVESEH